MTKTTDKQAADLGELSLDVLLDSWLTALQARGRSPRTIRCYRESAQHLIDYLRSAGMPTVAARVGREHIEAFLADQQTKVKPASVSVRYRALQQYFRWLTAEREIPSNPMASMQPPHVPEQPVPVIETQTILRLLATCEGLKFVNRRDRAIIIFLLDTGVRRSELAGMQVGDISAEHMTALVTGKGNRQRLVKFSPTALEAIDRYLRSRRQHSKAKSGALWLGPRGPLTDSGVAQILERRCAEAGIPRLHAHQFRHTFAHQWMASGGAEGDLMQLGGWKSRQMLDRYGKSAAAERARAAHRNHSPVERLMGQGWDDQRST
jgi:site-specific recombinase XerD